MILETLPDVQKLSKKEQWMLANELCDQVFGSSGEENPSKAIIDELDQRFAEYEADPEGTTTNWLDAKARIIAAHQKKKSA